MADKQFKIVTESKHFIYFVTEENENINWCLKIAVKGDYSDKFKNAVIDKTGCKVIMKIKLAIRHQPNYMKLNSYSDSPYKMKHLKTEYQKEIKNSIIERNITYENEEIPYYDYTLVLWEELNDKEHFYLYETPKQEMSWLTTPIDKDLSGLAMNVELTMQAMGKIDNRPPYIMVQNDYEDKHNLNWAEVRLDGSVIGNKSLIFTDIELKKLKTWLNINKLTILQYWTQEKDSSYVVKSIKKV